MDSFDKAIIMQPMYPAIKTYATHTLAVDDTHTLYIEECGNPEGKPVIILHSGPGAGCEKYHRRFFDPERYRIILFDQRGSGRSKPHASLVNNTTQHLIEDIETIREHFGLDRMRLFGGAWGSTLALLYAQAYPQNVSGLILHRVFLAREKDINWFYQPGRASEVFPDHFESFIKAIPEAERGDLIKAYAKRLSGNDELKRMSAAKAWSLWQAHCSSLNPHNDILEHFKEPHFATALAMIETHYFVNNCFIENNQILDNVRRIRHIPMFIVHGRYDMVCPLENAWSLHTACPSSELMVVRDAGHSIREPGIIDALIIASKNCLETSPPAC